MECAEKCLKETIDRLEYLGIIHLKITVCYRSPCSCKLVLHAQALINLNVAYGELRIRVNAEAVARPYHGVHVVIV